MKKIIYIVLFILLLLLLGFGIFYFFGNGKEKVANFFEDNTFGTFFDTQQQSQNDTQTDTYQETPDREPSSEKYTPPILRQISFEPISGYTFYSTSTPLILSVSTQQTPTTSTTSITSTTTTKDLTEKEVLFATSTVVRFQERATGHIYDVFEFIEAPQKISNNTVQKIYSTLFSTNKDSFIFKKPSFDNEQVQTTFVKLVYGTSSEVKLNQEEISSTINDFIFNEGANKLIYSVKQNNKSIIFSSNIDRTQEKSLTTLSFNDFLIDTINKNEVLITTKASKETPGYAYTLNLTTGSLDKILGNIPGLLLKISPDKKYYIYSQSEYSRPSVRLYNTEKKSLNSLSIDTIPSEKCVFSEKNNTVAFCFGSLIYKTGTYPDDWYKGKVFNNESLYEINLENGFVDVVYNFEENDPVFDVINPKLTTMDNFIIFENKNDLTLWSIDLERISN